MRFDPALTEAVVLGEIRQREAAGDSSLAHAYRCLAVPLYEEEPGEKREQGFARLHLQLFGQLGYPALVSDALAEFPDLTRRVQRLFVSRAFSRPDEGADLSQDTTSVGISVRAERFQDPPRLRAFLRHELMHVADMLEAAFAYRRDDSLFAHSPARRNVLRDRYRILWDITIDGRLTRANKETVADKEQRYREFSALFGNLPDPHRRQSFDRLWRAESVRHEELLRIADCGFDGPQSTIHNPPSLAGSPCPLCRFPTYEWTQALDATVIGAIQQDFPQWQSQQAVCERCAELYRLRAGIW
jgi:hypothetical protein